MDLHPSTQTSVHIYHGLEDDKKLNNCIAEQARSIYNICQSQLEIRVHYNAKSVSQHCIGAWRGKISKHNDDQACSLLIKHLSNRSQVSMGYKLINHAGCW